LRSLPFILLLAVPCLAQAVNPHTSPADVAAGGRIYRSHCADCHGLKGEGGKGPDLTTGNFFHGSSDAALLKNISDGIEGTPMPAQFFSPDQIWQVVAFVRTLSAKGSAKAPPGDPARGAQVYRASGCANCHLVKGDGGTAGPELSYIGSQRPAAHIRQSVLAPNALVDLAWWRADVTLESGAAFKGTLLNEDTYYVQMLHPARGLLTLPKKDFRRYQIDKTSAMPSYQGKLQPAQLDDLVAYLWSLQRPRRAE
jgi:putative heme-binding domain-containing protein